MVATDSTEAARRAIENLLALIGIQRVVCVDDEYADTMPVDEIIGLVSELDANRWAGIAELRDVPFDADDDVQAEAIRNIWTNLGHAAKKRVHRDLSSIANVDNDERDAYTLKHLFSDQELQELPLEEWEGRRSELLSEAEHTGTLFLFDRDFSKEGASRTLGMTLVQDVLQSLTGPEGMVGLLSHTFEPDDEHDTWRAVAEENDLDRNRFVLISKERLREDPVGFARMVKLTALSSKCNSLKEMVAEILHEAHAEAQQRVEDISVYDFEHIVFRSSRVEGIWEPETLFRVFGLFHTAKARELAKKKAELSKLATTIRSVSDIPIDPEPPPQHSSWKIRRMEMYEDADYLNFGHLPLELGDIFRKDTGGKEYILLSQPCDLMVRSEGGRHQAVTEALVAAIWTPPADSDRRPSNLEAYYELPYYDPATGAGRFVAFRSAQTVQLWVLDLCVYRDDGAAVHTVGQNVPPNVIPAWKRHHEKVTEIAEKALDKYRTVEELLGDKSVGGDNRDLILKRMIPQSSNSNVFKGTVDAANGQLDFQFKRVGRLRQPYAAAVLTKYANYHARAAFDHDFGRDP